MNISKKVFFPVLGLLALVAASCQKQDLISSEPIRRFSIDTLFYTNPDFGEFHMMQRTGHAEPVITENFIYGMVYVENGQASGTFRLLKIDAGTGAVVWSWSRFQLGDAGFAQSLQLQEGRLMLSTADNAYVISASDGATSFVYTKKENEIFAGAALLGDAVWISLYSQDEGAVLKKISLNGSGTETVSRFQTSNDFRYYPHALRVIDFHGARYVSWPVSNSSSGIFYSSPNIYLFQDGDTAASVVFSTAGGDSQRADEEGPELLVDNGDDNRLFVLTSEGIAGAYDMADQPPLQWVDQSEGSWLLQNDDNLYAVSLGNTKIYNKVSGELLAAGAGAHAVRAVTNDFLVATSQSGFGPQLSLYDSQSLEVLYEWESEGYIDELYKMNEEEFFFVNSLSRLGKIRITPVEE